MAIRTVTAAVIIGSIFSAGQIVIDVVREDKRTRAALNQTLSTVTPLAMKSAYELNSQAAADVIASLRAFAPISEAAIVSDKGDVLASIRRPSSDDPTNFGISEMMYADWRELAIPLRHETLPQPVGTLSIKFDTALLGEGVVQRAATTIAAGLLRNIFLALALIVVFYRFLAQPLVRLYQSFKNLDRNDPSAAYLQRPKNHEADELGKLTDIINHHLAGRTKSEEQLRQSQRLQAIGQLTGGIAHDFNNILGIIIGNLELIQLRASNDKETSALVDEAIVGAERGVSLTRKLLDYSRTKTRAQKTVRVNPFIERMENMLAKSLSASIQISMRLDADVWSIRIEPNDLEDAIINIALNARDAMPQGGSLTIETANKTFTAEHADHHPDIKAGEYVMISIKDTGVGIDPAISEQVLEPFFTTKAEGKGTGMGLSMVYGFVRRSNGHLELQSEVGEGTTVRIYLPRTHISDEAEAEGAEPRNTALPRGDETVLIVDDEAAMVKIAAEHLKSLGYSTVTARDGNEALQMLRDRPRVDLLFSDVVMPNGVDGYQLALDAQKAHPALKVLLTSGFPRTQADAATGEAGRTDDLTPTMLRKPYTKLELARAVREALQADKAVN